MDMDEAGGVIDRHVAVSTLNRWIKTVGRQLCLTWRGYAVNVKLVLATLQPQPQPIHD